MLVQINITVHKLDLHPHLHCITHPMLNEHCSSLLHPCPRCIHIKHLGCCTFLHKSCFGAVGNYKEDRYHSKCDSILLNRSRIWKCINMSTQNDNFREIEKVCFDILERGSLLSKCTKNHACFCVFACV